MKSLLLHIFLMLTFHASSQEAIFFQNPSFEDTPQYGKTPAGWLNCAFNEESPPDTHPVPNGEFNVTQIAHTGRTYAGLVARDVGTTESIGQTLASPLEAGRCYSFYLHLCRSNSLTSPSRATGKMANFNQPLSLSIWGGVSPCGQKTLLAISPPIGNTDWMKYSFQFQALENYTSLTFEAYFVEGTETAYNGNILLDNVGPILLMDCDTKEPLIDKDSLKNLVAKHGSPLPVNEGFTATGKDQNYKLVHSVQEVIKLAEANCPKIGFQFGSSKWENGAQQNLSETAVNVERQPGKLFLQIGILAVGENLQKRRIKAVKHTLRDAGLSKKHFEIIVLNEKQMADASWACGKNEISLRVVAGIRNE